MMMMMAAPVPFNMEENMKEAEGSALVLGNKVNTMTPMPAMTPRREFTIPSTDKNDENPNKFS